MRAAAAVVTASLATTGAFASWSPIRSDDWSSETHVWLARAMVAEAGWKSTRDHVAIAYVLARRLKAKRKRFPNVRFVHIIRGYCAGLEAGRSEWTPRQRWLHGLNLRSVKPDGWPERYPPWKQYRKRWRQVLKRVDDWRRGRLGDPCRGQAWHWGCELDVPGERMFPVDCGDTRNTFYGLTRRLDNGDKEKTARERFKRRDPR